MIRVNSYLRICFVYIGEKTCHKHGIIPPMSTLNEEFNRQFLYIARGGSVGICMEI